MKSRWVLTDDDVRDLLAVVERCDAADGDIFYPDVLVGLRELFPGADVGFLLLDAAEQRISALWADQDVEGVQGQVSVAPGDSEHSQMFWQEFWNDDGCAGPLRTGDHVTLLRHSDLWTERDYANTPFGSVRIAGGFRHEVFVPMTPHGGFDRRLLLNRREGRDFTEREMLMLRLIRPHMAELHTRRDRELRGVPKLTPRQWEILRCVESGATNTQIARTLGVSESAVRKHLENIFLRLQVLSRTEAVTRVRPFLDDARPLPAPLPVATGS